MERIKKNQHRLILNKIFNSPNNTIVKVMLDNNSEIIGSILDIDDDEIILKTSTGVKNTTFQALKEVLI